MAKVELRGSQENDQYCLKDVSGRVYGQGTIGATRRELDDWMKTLPQPWTAALEATLFYRLVGSMITSSRTRRR